MIAQHKLFVYDEACRTPVETRIFAGLEAAIAAAEAVMAERGAFAAAVAADPEASSLEDYLRAENLGADWLAAHPQPGALIGRLADAAHWRGLGIESAKALDDRLFWDSFSDSYKAATGFRPRFDDLTRAEAERMLESARQIGNGRVADERAGGDASAA